MRATYENEKTAFVTTILGGEMAASNAPPGIPSGDSHDIGALRYFGHYELVDLAGLVDEEAMARNRAELGQIDTSSRNVLTISWATSTGCGDFLHYSPPFDAGQPLWRCAYPTPPEPSADAITVSLGSGCKDRAKLRGASPSMRV